MISLPKNICAIAIVWLAGIGLISAAQHEIPPAFGPYLHPSPADFAGVKSFKSGDRMVGTYYFYWYDAPSQAHIINPGVNTDALTDHPPTLEGFSWKSVAWHRKQLLDMEYAGIDVALMVFWGGPSEHEPNCIDYWSFDGLKPLVEAREQLVREKHHPPAIGLFFDTSTLAWNSWHEHADLTTDYGKQFFYATVRDFYSCIPARDWAMIDNKPIVLLYAAAFAKNYDPSFIPYTKSAFASDFGREPFIAPQNSWKVKGDTDCAWGGALGLQRAGIDELGPGYDHSAVPGRAPLVVDRKGGKFYEENWIKFLRHPTPFVMLETWSEFHEGTDICESKEYGRQYIDLTRKYAKLFKQGWKPPAVAGKFRDAPSVDIVLGQKNQDHGLRQVVTDDGRTQPVVIGGSSAIKRASPDAHYMYFAADDSFKWADAMSARLIVEYFDAGAGSLAVEYDGSDSSAPFNGAYTRAGQRMELTDSKQWKTAEFDLVGAHFMNSENADSDFRLALEAPEICVRRVELVRK